MKFETLGGTYLPITGDSLLISTGLTLSQHTDGRPKLVASGSGLPSGSTGQYLRCTSGTTWAAANIAISEVTNLQTTLDAKWSSGNHPTTLSGYSITDAAPSSHVSADLNSAHGSTALNVAHGGTGQTSLTQNAVLIGNTTTAVQMITGVTAGHVLTWNGSGPPSFQAVSASGVTSFNSRTGAVSPQVGDYSSWFPQKSQSETIGGAWNFSGTAPTIGGVGISLSTHNHTGVYAPVSHTHGPSDITGGGDFGGTSATDYGFPGDLDVNYVITANGGYRVPQVYASTSDASGSYPEGTIWLKYTA